MFFNVKAMLKVMIISKGFQVGLMISLSQVWYTWGFVDLWIYVSKVKWLGHGKCNLHF